MLAGLWWATGAPTVPLEWLAVPERPPLCWPAELPEELPVELVFPVVVDELPLCPLLLPPAKTFPAAARTIARPTTRILFMLNLSYMTTRCRPLFNTAVRRRIRFLLRQASGEEGWRVHRGSGGTLNSILASWSRALPILRRKGSQRGSEWILSNRFSTTISLTPGS